MAQGDGEEKPSRIYSIKHNQMKKEPDEGSFFYT